MVADHIDEALHRKGAVDYGNCNGKSLALGQIMDRASNRGTVTCRRRSSSDYGLYNSFGSFKLHSKLVLIVIQLLLLSGFCRGDVLGHLFGHGWSWSPRPEAGRGEGRSMLSSAASLPTYCTTAYTAVAGETCASLRAATNLTQPQIYEINPLLNCKSIATGQSICVGGISARCARTVSVTKGPTNITCAEIEASGNLSTTGFAILNPNIRCPEAPGNNNSWAVDQLVCVFPGLGNVFAEYIGDSGLPITFTDLQPLYQKYPSVVKHVILGFAIDIDSRGTSTNGVFHTYWNPSLTPAAAQAFKAANSEVRLFISLGGPSKYVNSNDVWTDPPNNAAWIANAEKSLSTIASNYSIDGIDIYYDSFQSSASTNFVLCIGTLIQQLKGNNTIGLATIAPSASAIPEYTSLMTDFGDQFDLVNYKFYADQLSTVASYITELNALADNTFAPWKLLASTAINGTNTITGYTFLTAVNEIKLARGLPGVMFFDADHSVGANFQDEEEVMSLLGGVPYSNISNSTTPAPSPGSSPIVPGFGPAGAPGSSLAPALTPGAPNSSHPPAPGLAPKSSLAPALTPGAPHSSLTPGSAPGSSLSPHSGAPGSSLSPHSAAPGSSLSPNSAAPGSSLSPNSAAPGSSLSPHSGAPGSSLSPHAGAPGSSLSPHSGAPTPGSSLSPQSSAPGSSLAPRAGAPGSSLAPHSSHAPGSGPAPHSGHAPKSSPASAPAPGSEEGPGGNGTSLAPAPATPGSSSAPRSLLGSGWPSQGFGIFTAVLLLLFSL
ncbi:unnamed protein product [Calypogeia fissa]